MTMIAYAFLQHRRLTQARRGKKSQRTATSAKLAGRASRHRHPHRPLQRCPHCRKVLLHLKDGRLATAGEIALPDEFLIELPKDQEILLNTFFATERMGISIEGLIYKAWNTPGLLKAWQRLKMCNLSKE